MVSKAIAIDAMSGDFGPRVIIPSTLEYLNSSPKSSVIFVGDSQQIEPLIPKTYASRVSVVHAGEVVSMEDNPLVALKSKKESSMRFAIDLVKSADAGACVSAGNTGALMAISKYVLKMIEGVSRPAICGAVPSLNSHSYLLDMGANVDCEAEHLLQFALMAKILVRAVDGIDEPTAALLNNGEEDTKGNLQVKEAAGLLDAHKDVNYIGFIEGHELYQPKADIIVCDGFVGNIALKASEGVAAYIIEKIKQEINSDIVSKCLSFFALPEFRRIKSKIDPRRLNGASLLGLQGVVVKSHGHADVLAFQHAVVHAEKMMSVDIVSQLNDQFLGRC